VSVGSARYGTYGLTSLRYIKALKSIGLKNAWVIILAVSLSRLAGSLTSSYDRRSCASEEWQSSKTRAAYWMLVNICLRH
jgi:hypothetical protein